MSILTSFQEKTLHRRCARTALVVGIIFIVLCGLLLPVLSGHTWAASSATVNIWLRRDSVEANPAPGEPGSLHEKLEAIVTCNGHTAYSGPLGGMPATLDISSLAGPIAAGKTVKVNFTVGLPGAVTGNESQGARLATAYTLVSELVDPDKVYSSFKTSVRTENEALFDLRNMEPGDEYSADLWINFGGDPVSGDLPRTSGRDLATYIALSGFLIILGGLALGKRRRKGGELV